MILVTGANGTNGSEILKRLSGKDAAVRATVRTPRDPAKHALLGVEFVTADSLLNIDAPFCSEQQTAHLLGRAR